MHGFSLSLPPSRGMLEETASLFCYERVRESASPRVRLSASPPVRVRQSASPVLHFIHTPWCSTKLLITRSKHIDTKLHFVRERVENKEIKIHYVPTEEMTADILTKSLPRVKVEKHRTILLGN